MSGDNVLPIAKAKRMTPWGEGIICNEKGAPKKCLANALHVLALHPKLEGAFAYDEFAEEIVKLKPLPTREQDAAGGFTPVYTEQDATRLCAWFASTIGFEPTVHHVDAAVAAVAEKRKVHPVRDYLRGLIWDGVPRLETVLATYFGASNSEYIRSIGARFLISAVARIMQPGCQVDCMLVLESEKQGIGKSTGIAALFGDVWHADTGISVGDKDSYQALRRKWVYEFGELASIKGREVERVKNFVSARADTFRPSYARRTRDFQRQVVFVATTNDTQYLTDTTGNRRFWGARCERNVDVAAIRRDRDQLWAEACCRYEDGDAWHVNTPELRQLCEDAQRAREVDEPWIDLVAAWLRYPRVPVLNSKSNETSMLKLAEGITTTDALVGAIEMKKSDCNAATATRIGKVLGKLGWKPSENPLRRDGKRVRLYFPPTQPAQPEAKTGCADEEAVNVP